MSVQTRGDGDGGWVGGEVTRLAVCVGLDVVEVTRLVVVYRFRRGVGGWGMGGDVTRRWYIGSDEEWVGG